MYFIVSLLILLLSCGEEAFLQGNLREVFLRLYEEGSYRFYTERVKREKEGCEVLLRDLIKERKLRLRLVGDCSVFSERTHLEVAGERFTPPGEGNVLNRVELRRGLYLWVYSVPRRREGGGGILFVPFPWGGIDVGRYGEGWGRYGGK